MPQNPEVPNRSNKPSALTNQAYLGQYPGQYPAYPQQYPAPPNQYGVQVNSNTFQFQGNSQSMYEAYSAQNMGPGTSDKAIRYGEPWLKQSLTFSVTNQPQPATQHQPVIHTNVQPQGQVFGPKFRYGFCDCCADQDKFWTNCCFGPGISSYQIATAIDDERSRYPRPVD